MLVNKLNDLNAYGRAIQSPARTQFPPFFSTQVTPQHFISRTMAYPEPKGFVPRDPGA